MDVDALGYLLSKSNYLTLLLSEAARPVVRVRACQTSFEVKDILKSRGYSWNNTDRYWWKDEPKDQMELVWNWLNREVYKYGGIQNCTFEEIENHKKFDF